MSLCRRLTLVGALLWTSGCDGGGADVQPHSLRLVYGADNRQELYEGASQDALRALARTSLLAFGRASEIQAAEPGPAGEALVRVTSPSAKERFGLCAGERFGQQPAFAVCSGFPIAPDLAITADHCLNVVPAHDIAVLSGFYATAPDVVAPLAASQVRSVDEVLARDPWRDIALLRLRGAALSALSLAPLGSSLVGTAVSSVNHGMGVPAKLMTGAQAYSVGESWFLTDLDAFGGASGAPVFDDAHNVIGVLTSGLADYDQTDTGCWTAHHQTDGSLAADELVERAQSALDDLCAIRFVPEVCGGVPPAAQGCALTLVPRRGDLLAWAIPLGFAVLISGMRRRGGRMRLHARRVPRNRPFGSHSRQRETVQAAVTPRRSQRRCLIPQSCRS